MCIFATVLSYPESMPLGHGLVAQFSLHATTVKRVIYNPNWRIGATVTKGEPVSSEKAETGNKVRVWELQ